ncbi:MAG: hypothetical protein HY705_05870 [Gemmatimonadetes bacterium]|nr:hypothetical protein [Gemmatimonadota bacterium]
MRHLRWARDRYREMLGRRDSFALADSAPRVVRAAHPLAFYRALPESGVPQMLGELLDQLGLDRFNCPYVFVVVVMNPRDDYPVGGGGRTIIRGVNPGGGVVVLASYALDHSPNFQSTLQHELGHGFGLPHVEVYGYDMGTSPSVMSYNPAHHTSGFAPSRTPGTLIPEDIRALRHNRGAFPNLARDTAQRVPPGYRMAPMVSPGAMLIPGQPPYRVEVTTTSGEAYGSSVANIVRGRIAPSRGPGITFDGERMWHSDSTGTGWVTVDVTFPTPVTLDRLVVHSQHSGAYHAATGIRVQVAGNGSYRDVVTRDLARADDDVPFAPAAARTWRLSFRAGESGQVTIRGIEFFSGVDEVFPRCPPE